MLVRVVGVDLSAEPMRTAVAVLAWDDGKAVVEELYVGADDEGVLAALATADKAGIDAPFGWPDAFAAFLAAHQAGDVPVPVTGIIPLSVAADRIGHAAMRCAGLLTRLGRSGSPVNRDGSGTVTEVYPAASLNLWGLSYRGYKQPRNPAALPELAGELQAAVPWPGLGSHDHVCRTSHDALDAIIAALTGPCSSPEPEYQARSRTTGRSQPRRLDRAAYRSAHRAPVRGTSLHSFNPQRCARSPTRRAGRRFALDAWRSPNFRICTAAMPRSLNAADKCTPCYGERPEQLR